MEGEMVMRRLREGRNGLVLRVQEKLWGVRG